ncbi:MAG: ATP-binding cassette domain-containing protein [Bacteroidota bacterium]
MSKNGLHIELQQLGKKFYQRWLFRGINHDFSEQPHLAIIGKNGSGKSTLMRIISGQMNATEGKVIYRQNQQLIPASKRYQQLSWSGPHVQVYADLSWQEQLDLHFRFCDCLLPNREDLHDLLHLQSHRHKKLRFFSSGMLQRAKVGLALFSKSNLLMLDEPTSHMDVENAQLMLGLIRQHLGNRIFVLASNMEREYAEVPHKLFLKG